MKQKKSEDKRHRTKRDNTTRRIRALEVKVKDLRGTVEALQRAQLETITAASALNRVVNQSVKKMLQVVEAVMKDHMEKGTEMLSEESKRKLMEISEELRGVVE